MTKFNVGDKIKLVNDEDMDYNLTLGKVYVVRDLTTSGSCVYITDNDCEQCCPYAYRFELVKDDKPTLKPGMRVTLQGNSSGIVIRNCKDELAIALNSGGWSEIYYDETDNIYREFNIVKVYEAPLRFYEAQDLTARGEVVWTHAQFAARDAADAAVAEAEKALAAAKAARAAL